MAIEPLAGGLVSQYEERETARFALYNWTDWQALPDLEKVFAVAHYRVQQLVEAHVQDAVQQEVNRRSKLAGAG